MSTFLILVVIAIVALTVYYIADKWESQLPYKPASRRPRYTGNKIVKICPRCGEIDSETVDQKFPCVFCKFEYPVSTEYTYAFYINELSCTEILDFEEQLRHRYVLTEYNKDLDITWYNQRREKERKRDLQIQELSRGASELHASKSNQYACPVCGGTSFTPVRRKWTFMAGYRTNKIDMVCNKCGHVKEG